MVFVTLNRPTPCLPGSGAGLCAMGGSFSAAEPRPELKPEAFDGTRPLVICVVGSGGVGKTSLVRRLQLDEMPSVETAQGGTPGSPHQRHRCTLEYNTTVDLRAATGDPRRVAVTLRDVDEPAHLNVRPCIARFVPARACPCAWHLFEVSGAQLSCAALHTP